MARRPTRWGSKSMMRLQPSGARMLGAEPFEQQPGKGEVMLPGIRGVGGSVLYLLDDRPDLTGVWDSEFSRDKSAAPDVGLVRVDHVAQTMDYDEMFPCCADILRQRIASASSFGTPRPFPYIQLIPIIASALPRSAAFLNQRMAAS